MLLDCQKDGFNPAHQPKTRAEFAMHILPRAALAARAPIGKKGALLRAPACVDVGVDLADHDLGAIQGDAIEPVAESFAIVMRPKSTDRPPDLLLATFGDCVNSVCRPRGSDWIGHMNSPVRLRVRRIGDLDGRLRSRRKSSAVIASRQAPRRADLHTRSTEGNGFDGTARLDRNGALRGRFIGGGLVAFGKETVGPRRVLDRIQ
jgi:hypothetical protein